MRAPKTFTHQRAYRNDEAIGRTYRLIPKSRSDVAVRNRHRYVPTHVEARRYFDPNNKDAFATIADSINSAGVIAGHRSDVNGVYHGFARLAPR